jgi:hypothetical protein
VTRGWRSSVGLGSAQGGLQLDHALRAKDIQRLRDEGFIQFGLFDERELAEISAPWFPGERLIVCRNPLVAEERRRKRQELLSATVRELGKIKEERGCGPAQESQGDCSARGQGDQRWKMGKHIEPLRIAVSNTG